MPKRSTYPSIKALIISSIVISLTACSSGTESSKAPSDSTTSSNSQTTEQTAESPAPSSDPVATAPASSSAGEVPQPEEVKFQEPAQDVVAGYLDTVNGKTEPSQTIAKAEPIVVTGWAIVPNGKQPADMVLITLKDNKSIISTAKVDGERKDVADLLKQPSMAMSGWDVQIDPATLPSEKVVLQAWAYNSETKEAYPLTNSPEITRQ